MGNPFQDGTGCPNIQEFVCSPSETGSDHLHVIADEVSRVAKLCIGQDMGTVSTTTAFMNMEAGTF